MPIRNWNRKELNTVTSKGSVLVLENPYDNLIRGDVSPWPHASIVQKLYQSRQSRAFSETAKNRITHRLGYYCDLQSIHSEDAITWSVFGTIAHKESSVRNRWINELMRLLNVPISTLRDSEIFLWRRIPHAFSNNTNDRPVRERSFKPSKEKTVISKGNTNSDEEIKANVVVITWMLDYLRTTFNLVLNPIRATKNSKGLW